MTLFTALMLLMLAIAISAGSWWRDQTLPPPNFAGYYDGPWVNKRGQLVAPDGTIISERNGKGKSSAPAATIAP